MSANHPGPYGPPPGQPPGQPGPHGQPPAYPGGQPPGQPPGGVPGYGFPQQPPPGPPGQPGQPGQPPGMPPGPPGGPYGPYGQSPPPGPGSGKSNKPLLIGLAVVVVAAAAGGLFLLLGGDDDGGGVSADRQYVLSPAPSAGDWQHQGEESGMSLPDEILTQVGVEKDYELTASYTLPEGSGAVADTASLAGVVGTVGDPESAIDSLVEAAPVEWHGELQSVTPGGLENAIMKCREVRSTSFSAGPGDAEATTTERIDVMCAWSDYSTFGYFQVSHSGDAEESEQVTIDEAARVSAEVLSAVRTEVPSGEGELPGDLPSDPGDIPMPDDLPSPELPDPDELPNFENFSG